MNVDSGFLILASGYQSSEMSLIHKAQDLCRKYGFDLGIQYLERNGEKIKLSNLGPNVDVRTRLVEICKLAKLLKLKIADARELASLIYYTCKTEGYNFNIKGGGPDIIGLIICLAAAQADISIIQKA